MWMSTALGISSSSDVYSAILRHQIRTFLRKSGTFYDPMNQGLSGLIVIVTEFIHYYISYNFFVLFFFFLPLDIIFHLLHQTPE